MDTAPRTEKQAFSEPDQWQDIARSESDLEWCATCAWDSLQPYYQVRIQKLAEKRTAADQQQLITDRIAP